ncbi:MAG TPA: S46 family peptidase, partial [Bacteroidota bacterium]|nr:S46 family peptidase [Bacteroidota bacterium]
MKKIFLIFSILFYFQISYTQTKSESWLDTVKFSPIDNGKMWIFDNPPKDYFYKTYNFMPSDSWFETARLSAIRLPGCSASLISEDGLIMTNHHCARSSISKVTRVGENLSENGFYAKSLSEERKIPGYYVDQLQLIEDVTKEVQEAFEKGKTDEEKVQLRNKKISEIESRYSQKTGLICDVITFYNGGRYSVYGYKRYTDIRLVFAPETKIGFFGGDYDNFTYPRYDMDMSFMRIYDNGKPFKTKNYFKWSKDGA